MDSGGQSAVVTQTVDSLKLHADSYSEAMQVSLTD